MSLREYFAGASFRPYWWDEAPRPTPEPGDPPRRADVVVVGTGFTGLSAALTLSRAGRSVVALDAGEIGFGASTRNGGQIGPGNQKFSVAHLIDMFGRDRARRLYQEGRDMLAFFKALVRSEEIDCELRECGRFRGAVTAAHYDVMARELEACRRFAGVSGFVVEKADVGREIDTGAYCGGVVLSEDGGVHPARFHDGLAERTRRAGAVLRGGTPVLGYRRERRGFTVTTSRGEILARDLVVATNGYTGAFAPRLRRRIVPVGSGIIATEPMGRERLARLLPGERVYGETRRVFCYFRPSPDGTRLLFGGRCFDAHSERSRAYHGLYRSMLRIFPGLAGVRITHAWSGNVGMSRDHLPHVGVEGGAHYALGYSGTGVTRATYFGHKLALKVLGRAECATSFDDLPFRSQPVPARLPVVVNTAVRWMQLRDAVDGWRAAVS